MLYISMLQQKVPPEPQHFKQHLFNKRLKNHKASVLKCTGAFVISGV